MARPICDAPPAYIGEHNPVRFKSFGEGDQPAVALLHGGGLSWWSWQPVIDALQDQYHIITPIIDGHGEDANTTFRSITDSTNKLLAYLDAEHDGHVFAIGGLSIGAQIAVEALTRRPDLTEKAVVESALVFPMKSAAALAAPTYRLFYGLIRQRWYAKIQSRYLFVPADQFELYYRDSSPMSSDSLVNMTRSNASYTLNPAIGQTSADVLILVGEKELSVMKKSAQALHDAIPSSTLTVLSDSGHGEISLARPDEYVTLLREFFAR